MRSLVALAVGVASLVVAPCARADQDYPAALQFQLSLKYTPGCDLCHEAAKDPVGPADTPFAKSMIARGLKTHDVKSLATALDKMKTDMVDSDGDGSLDLDELSWGGDPNHAEKPAGGSELPAQYGCAIAHDDASSWPTLVALSALLVAFVARRRR